ncbi:putative lipoprotein [Myxococcus stipitatus DSM 14675]|uniref:Putative lipoprotein n=1 Tax=Myxococcus stipitatus (strain DSM 14675 / JCM 12634 / Mx s8) TaxID=1278073 RepID=L7UH48_MYXSD|nr:mannosyltransferase family protein [Myxococcus stipitatus]AGC47210.1 putative lipoprotein [Myxococcus stipitatus DSM 14675]
MARSASRTITLVVVVAVVLCGILAGIGARRIFHKNPQNPIVRIDEYVTMGWVAWDSSWYMRIVQEGYQYTPGEQSSVAFFPLYPMLIRAVETLGPNVYQAGVLITLLCGPLALILFTKWAKVLSDEDTALKAGLLMATYPFAMYLYGAMYSDALFILLVIAAFLLLEKGHLAPAVLVAAVATAARPVAPAVVLGLLVRRLEWKHARGEKWNAMDFLPVLSGLGFGCYMLYLWHQFGDPFAFVKVQGAPGWDQQPGWHTWLKARWFDRVVVNPSNTREAVRLVIHAFFTFLALALVWPTRKRLGWGYAVFVLAIVGLPAWSTKDFMGMGRYLLSSFPVFLTAALMLKERPKLLRGVVAFGAASVLFLSWAFGSDHYIS